jgi:hypothetical protein
MRKAYRGSCSGEVQSRFSDQQVFTNAKSVDEVVEEEVSLALTVFTEVFPRPFKFGVSLNYMNKNLLYPKSLK